MKLKVKKLTENAILPTRGSASAAGWDLYSAERASINGGETVKVNTGIAVEIPEGYFGAIYARSGLATNDGLRPANCVGVIDSDYRGPIIVPLHNDNSPVVKDYRPVDEHTSIASPSFNILSDKVILEGTRIAQLIIQKYEDVEIEEVEELSETKRGEGGFGSTGAK